MDKARINDWVRIYNVILEPKDRAPQVPEDTKKVPLEMWIKGYMIDEEAKLGDSVTIKTVTGRCVTGTLVEIFPSFQHGFGSYVQELGYIGPQLREILQGGDLHE